MEKKMIEKEQLQKKQTMKFQRKGTLKRVCTTRNLSNKMSQGSLNHFNNSNRDFNSPVPINKRGYSCKFLSL